MKHDIISEKESSIDQLLKERDNLRTWPDWFDTLPRPAQSLLMGSYCFGSIILAFLATSKIMENADISGAWFIFILFGILIIICAIAGFVGWVVSGIMSAEPRRRLKDVEKKIEREKISLAKIRKEIGE